MSAELLLGNLNRVEDSTVGQLAGQECWQEQIRWHTFLVSCSKTIADATLLQHRAQYSDF